jgi:tetratricopeptide (TPR) repeat protein
MKIGAIEKQARSEELSKSLQLLESWTTTRATVKRATVKVAPTNTVGTSFIIALASFIGRIFTVVLPSFVGATFTVALAVLLFCPLFATKTNAQNLDSILTKLYIAADAPSVKKPKIQLFDKHSSQIAWYDASNQTIYLEKQAYDVCLSFGENASSALAFIIGHELVHSFQHDKGKSAFAAHGCDDVKKLQYETEADVRGAFVAHLAGFKTKSLIPSILQKLYDSYQLSNAPKLRCYPSETVRQQTALQVQAKVDSLEHIFEAARFFGLLGNYTAATTAYQYILRTYNGAEVWNDLAVLYAHRAMSVGGKSPDTLLLPFELAAQLRIRPLKSEPLTASELKTRAVFLKKALEASQQALALKPDYNLAKINKASILILQKRGQEAEKVVANLDKKQADEAILLRGLLAMTQGKQADATRLFESLKTSKNDRVRLWAKANQERIAVGTANIAPCSFPALPTIDGVFGYKKAKKTAFITPNLQFGWENHAHSTVFWATHTPKDGDEESSKMSIQVIHQTVDFDASMGVAACLFGDYAVDNLSGLVFQLKNEKVVKWARVLK